MSVVFKVKRRAVVAAAVVMAGSLAASRASAATLADWNLYSNASSPNGLAATAVSSPATAAGLYENGTVTGNTATYSYDTKGFAAGVQADNVEASLSVGSATTVTDFVGQAFGSNTGPGTVDVYYSVDGGSLVSDGTLTITGTNGSVATAFDLTFNGGATINSSLNVYFSADANGVSVNGGALSSGGTFRLNNVGDNASTPLQFEGFAASSVPSPATIPASLAGLGLVGGLSLARRRRSFAL